MDVEKVNAIEVLATATHDGICVITTSCHSTEEFIALPRVIRATLWGKGIFVKTAWNSDKNEAYYRDDKPVAYAI